MSLWRDDSFALLVHYLPNCKKGIYERVQIMQITAVREYPRRDRRRTVQNARDKCRKRSISQIRDMRGSEDVLTVRRQEDARFVGIEVIPKTQRHNLIDVV